MKVRVYSDVHLEFFAPNETCKLTCINPDNADVLVLAGDIVTVHTYKKSSYQKIYNDFLTQAVNNYDKVFMVMGNHEHYQYNFSQTEEKLRSLLPKGVILLEKEVYSYKNVDFVGASLWTDFRRGDPFEIIDASTQMNDYSIILYGAQSRRLRPEDTYKHHNETIFWLENVLPALQDNVFVITHHAPSFQSIEKEYRAQSLCGAYASSLEKLIEANPNIKHWAHGHTHCSNDYEIAQCRVISNAHGYQPYGLNPTFKNDLVVEIA